MGTITDFYLGKRLHPLGYSIEEVWSWGDHRLEAEHTYIQWLFPLRERSRAVPGSPVLTDEEIEQFRSRAELRERLIRSLQRMLTFYGFTRQPAPDGDEEVRIRPAPGFETAKPHWVTPYNHNYLRITRILKSLVLLGLPGPAGEFFAALKAVYSRHSAVIGGATYEYWRQAVS